MSSSIDTGTGTRVFLGGSCDPTTWRKDIAIPALEAADIEYYNPQVDGWDESLVAIEAAAKKAAEHFLFVIDAETRATSSAVEVSTLIAKGRSVFLVVKDMADGAVIADEAPVTGRQLKDLNRMRSYLCGEAEEEGVTVYTSVAAAVDALVAQLTGVPA